jgi:hypothetical protein
VIGAAQSGFHEYIGAELLHRLRSFPSALDIYCNDIRQASRRGGKLSTESPLVRESILRTKRRDFPNEICLAKRSPSP